jgi:hypothetical protein
MSLYLVYGDICFASSFATLRETQQSNQTIRPSDRPCVEKILDSVPCSQIRN